MSAYEMFIELGYELLQEVDKTIYRKSWNYKEMDLTYYFKSFRKIIKFRLENKYVSTILFGCGDDTDREQKQNIKLHQAIHQQMKELGWLDECN